MQEEYLVRRRFFRRCRWTAVGPEQAIAEDSFRKPDVKWLIARSRCDARGFFGE
jgi:hypothetical protein